jgi:phenylacetic acid degradation protein paaN
MRAVAPRATWQRSFGSAQISLEKHYRLVARGVAVCFTCASFPTWNAYPSMIASLATGNAVIVKPHPATVLPMAISVAVFRQTLAAAGFDANLVSMALDTTADPVGKRIVKHPLCAIVDFTGSARFGQWVEEHAHPALCYTETSGCNTVVLESCDDLDAVIRSLATTLCLFSAQMCTSPQNIYIPEQGVRVGRGAAQSTVSFDDVAQRLAAAVDAIGGDPRKASSILAAIQSPATLALIDELSQQAGSHVLLASRSYAHPEFPQAIPPSVPDARELFRCEPACPAAVRWFRCPDQ